MNPEQILQQEFELLRDDLVKRYDELGMRASSNFDRETEAVSKRLSAKLYAPHYIEQLSNGREPGKFPPISAIEQWIEDKPIETIGISVGSLAFLIARKIANEGTEYFKQGGTDLIESVITPERIQSIIDKVSIFYQSDLEQFVFNQLAELAAA